MPSKNMVQRSASSGSKQSNADTAPSSHKCAAVVGQPGKRSCFDEKVARSSLGTLSEDDVQADVREAPLDSF